jgi:hypothetical protein
MPVGSVGVVPASDVWGPVGGLEDEPSVDGVGGLVIVVAVGELQATSKIATHAKEFLMAVGSSNQWSNRLLVDGAGAPRI